MPARDRIRHGHRRPAAAAAVLALTAGAALTGVAPAGGRPSTLSAPARPTTRAATTATPRVLVEPRLFDPQGVAVGPGGAVYVADPSGRIGVANPDGTHAFLRVAAVPHPKGVAVADDGTLFVGGDGLAAVAPDGGERELAVPGLQDAAFLDVDSAGSLYVTDPAADQVHRIAPDGTAEELTFTGLTEISGIDAADDGTVSVLDVAGRDVVRRAADGTQTDVGFAGLEMPVEVDVQGDRIVVSQSTADGAGSVLVREADGTTAPAPVTVFRPGGVVLAADGTITVADSAITDCRCPPSPGSVYRMPPTGDRVTVDLGDIGAFGGVAATAPGTVLFTSWQGSVGYSDPNPLRRVTGSDAPVDVPTGSATGQGMDAAPDGTVYRSDGHQSLTRTTPDGTTSEIGLPTKPGVDAIADLSVDEDGRLFVALGSGYGTGGYAVIEPLAEGGPKTWYEGDGNGENFVALAAGGGRVVLVTAGATSAVAQAWDLDGSGGRTERPLPELIGTGDAEVDQAGTLWLVSFPVDRSRIDVITSDGQASRFEYEGMTNPGALSMGTDGTLYLADTDLLAFDGVGPTAVPDDGPVAPAAPAAPVDGTSSFTG